MAFACFCSKGFHVILNIVLIAYSIVLTSKQVPQPAPLSDNFYGNITVTGAPLNFTVTGAPLNFTVTGAPLNFTVSDLNGPARALFVFGDSTVDAGNYRFIGHPYGMDTNLISVPRFTNGLTIADYLAVKMGTSIPQAYNSLGPEQLKDKSININFASAGCGLLSKTNPDIPCTSMSDQVIQMVNARPGDSTRGSAVYFVSVGANDFIFSFKGPFDRDPDKFTEKLVSKLKSYMKLLVTFGDAKIFLINNLAPVGCIPNKSNCTRSCDDKINEGVKAFNVKLVDTLKNFRKDYDVTILLADSVRMFAALVDHPWDFGLKNITHPCCGEWNTKANRFDCRNQTQFCSNRDEYLFFDGAHLTQNANKVFVDYCILGRVCYPIESV